MNHLTSTVDPVAWVEQISRDCYNSSPLVPLVCIVLGCDCNNLKVEGLVFCARGKEVTAGNALYLSTGCEIWDFGPVRIGDNVVFGPGVKIRAAPGRPVSIGHRVWLGEGVEIYPGSQIGDNSVVCAHTRVEGEVPARSVVRGNPPRVLRTVR
jgi:maltose O-acetyltransferase